MAGGGYVYLKYIKEDESVVKEQKKIEDTLAAQSEHKDDLIIAPASREISRGDNLVESDVVFEAEKNTPDALSEPLLEIVPPPALSEVKDDDMTPESQTTPSEDIEEAEKAEEGEIVAAVEVPFSDVEVDEEANLEGATEEDGNPIIAMEDVSLDKDAEAISEGDVADTNEEVASDEAEAMVIVSVSDTDVESSSETAEQSPDDVAVIGAEAVEENEGAAVPTTEETVVEETADPTLSVPALSPEVDESVRVELESKLREQIEADAKAKMLEALEVARKDKEAEIDELTKKYTSLLAALSEDLKQKEKLAMLMEQERNELKERNNRMDEEYSNAVMAIREGLLAQHGERMRRLDEQAQLLLQHDTIVQEHKVVAQQHSQINRMSIAAGKLKDALENHKSDLEKPLEKIGEAFRDRPVVAVALKCVTESGKWPAGGVYSSKMLYRRFKRVDGSCTRASLVPPEGGMWWHIASFIVATVWRKAEDAEGDENDVVLARARGFMHDGDLGNAVCEMEKLSGAAADIAGDWLIEAKKRLIVENLFAVTMAETLTHQNSSADWRV
eukprot:TRINITY_DN16821_c0_g1_i1.p1 TRINITY_DN16821_c0_g1~~TRINITY_DN16821_c0_g1_i1.p1  ORF type:complete len:559 (+),score=177.18 TRINITY_DN16821_c0_g1_i1:135-1811(+)